MHLLQEGGKLHPSQIIPIDESYMYSNCTSQLCGSKGLRGSFTIKIHSQNPINTNPCVCNLVPNQPFL
jgi:hypothetical protein